MWKNCVREWLIELLEWFAKKYSACAVYPERSPESSLGGLDFLKIDKNFIDL